MAEAVKFCSLLCLKHSHLIQSHVHMLSVFDGFIRCLSFACPDTHSVDQVGLKVRDLPASVSAFQRAGIKDVHHHTQL